MARKQGTQHIERGKRRFNQITNTTKWRRAFDFIAHRSSFTCRRIDLRWANGRIKWEGRNVEHHVFFFLFLIYRDNKANTRTQSERERAKQKLIRPQKMLRKEKTKIWKSKLARARVCVCILHKLYCFAAFELTKSNRGGKTPCEERKKSKQKSHEIFLKIFSSCLCARFLSLSRSLVRFGACNWR